MTAAEAIIYRQHYQWNLQALPANHVTHMVGPATHNFQSLIISLSLSQSLSVCLTLSVAFCLSVSLVYWLLEMFS